MFYKIRGSVLPRLSHAALIPHAFKQDSALSFGNPRIAEGFNAFGTSLGRSQCCYRLLDRLGRAWRLILSAPRQQYGSGYSNHHFHEQPLSQKEITYHGCARG